MYSHWTLAERGVYMVSGVTVRCFSNVAERFLELTNNFQIIIFWVSLWRRRNSVTCQISFFTKQILLYEQILNYDILTKASSETIFPKKSNHYGEGYSVTCQVFFFTRQETILSLLSGSRPWGTLIYQEWKNILLKMLNTYEDDNQIACIHYMGKW